MAVSKGAPSPWIVLACVGSGSLMNGINSSVVIAVLPLIARNFATDMSTISWVPMANLITLGALLLTFGRLADLVGYRRVFVTGLATLLAGSVLAGLSPNEFFLIAWSVVQACGSGMVVAAGLALVTQAFGDEHRGRGIGLLIGITYAGLVAGPALGGVVAGTLGWRAVFYLNVPVALAGLLASPRMLPADQVRSAGARFDHLGAVASIVALTSLLLGLSHGQEWGWTSLATFGCFGVAALAGAAFFHIEQAHPEPMLDLHLLRNRLFSTALSSAVLNYVAAFFQTFLVPFYLLQARGFSPETAGLLIVVTAVAMVALTPFAGNLSDRIGSRLLASCGLCISAAGLLALSMLDMSSSIGAIAIAQLIAGIGAGLFSSPNTSAIMGQALRDHRGTAAGMQAMARNIGMVLGIALAGAIFNARLAALGGPTQFVGAFHDTLVAGAVVALAGALVSASRGSLTKPSGAIYAPLREAIAR